jgi:hypothetical protein
MPDGGRIAFAVVGSGPAVVLPARRTVAVRSDGDGSRRERLGGGCRLAQARGRGLSFQD